MSNNSSKRILIQTVDNDVTHFMEQEEQSMKASHNFSKYFIRQIKIQSISIFNKKNRVK